MKKGIKTIVLPLKLKEAPKAIDDLRKLLNFLGC